MRNESYPIRSSIDIAKAYIASLTFDGTFCHGPEVGDKEDVEQTCAKFDGKGNEQHCSVSSKGTLHFEPRFKLKLCLVHIYVTLLKY